MADTLSLYKLIILKMLEQVEYPLTNSQITEFILDKEYTNYFTVQQALSEMDETGLVNVTTKRNNSLYHITDAGKNTLEFFGNKISDAILTEDVYKRQALYRPILDMTVVTIISSLSCPISLRYLPHT